MTLTCRRSTPPTISASRCGRSIRASGRSTRPSAAGCSSNGYKASARHCAIPGSGRGRSRRSPTPGASTTCRTSTAPSAAASRSRRATGGTALRTACPYSSNKVGLDELDLDLSLHLDAMHEDADRREIGRGAWHAARSSRPGIGEPQAFDLLIGIVLGPRAGHQMIGIAAAPDVATVAQHQTLGDRPVLRLPGQAMGEVQLVAEPQAAVAVLQVGLPDVAAAQRVGP